MNPGRARPDSKVAWVSGSGTGVTEPVSVRRPDYLSCVVDTHEATVNASATLLAQIGERKSARRLPLVLNASSACSAPRQPGAEAREQSPG
jgi:hypothetical protein